MEERELLILGQQEHEQLLDEEISQLKRLLQEKEKELLYAYSLSKESAVRMQQQAQQQRLLQPRSEMDIVERLESLEQEVVQLRRRTPTLADLKCVAPEHHVALSVTLLQGREHSNTWLAQRQRRRCGSGGGGCSSSGISDVWTRARVSAAAAHARHTHTCSRSEGKLPYGVVVHGYTAKDAHSVSFVQVSSCSQRFHFFPANVACDV